jgi:hypothetical protein
MAFSKKCCLSDPPSGGQYHNFVLNIEIIDAIEKIIETARWETRKWSELQPFW